MVATYEKSKIGTLCKTQDARPLLVEQSHSSENTVPVFTAPQGLTLPPEMRHPRYPTLFFNFSFLTLTTIQSHMFSKGSVLPTPYFWAFIPVLWHCCFLLRLPSTRPLMIHSMYRRERSPCRLSREETPNIRLCTHINMLSQSEEGLGGAGSESEGPTSSVETIISSSPASRFKIRRQSDTRSGHGDCVCDYRNSWLATSIQTKRLNRKEKWVSADRKTVSAYSLL